MSTDITNTAIVDLLAERLAPVVREAVEAATRAALAGRAPEVERPLLTVAQVATRLGSCTQTVRRLAHSGRLRAVSGIGHLRFEAETVEDFVRGAAADDDDDAGGGAGK